LIKTKMPPTKPVAKAAAPAKPAAKKSPGKKRVSPVVPAITKRVLKKHAALPKIVQKWLKHRATRPLWSKIRKEAKAKKVDPKTLIRAKKTFEIKKIGGDKNGGTRKVLLRKPRKYYPTEDRKIKSRSGNVCYKTHARKFKTGLEPGRVVIVLAGRHKGKRVVVLKQLPSGLILVSGPHVINGCPIRRMHQQYVIVTSTKLDFSKVNVPENINDRYFKRLRNDKNAKKSKKSEGGDIFGAKAEAYKPDAARKADQIAVDKMIVEVVKKSNEKKLLMSYLGSYFQIRNGVYPHKLKF